MSKPVDDVYLTWLYRRPSYGLEQAVGMLKRFQELDFTHPKQFVYINVFLDMALQKKKKVDPFSSGVALPHRFTDEVNKVLVFTENEQEAEVAREHGAAIVGGVELIKWILEDEIQADFYVAVPAIIPKLIPLRNKLRKKYPSTKRNSLGSDIPRMVQFFRECHEYSVEDESVIKTRIARLDMPTEHIIANLKTIIQDICTFKPSNFDPIVQRLVIRSSTSEGLLLNLDGILPQVEKAEEKEEEDAADEDQQKAVQESEPNVHLETLALGCVECALLEEAFLEWTWYCVCVQAKKKWTWKQAASAPCPGSRREGEEKPESYKRRLLIF
ncbi:large ribosomal subunit protein uL1m-like isoform X6 [Zonotrichia leucophrys gambelii]